MNQVYIEKKVFVFPSRTLLFVPFGTLLRILIGYLDLVSVGSTSNITTTFVFLAISHLYFFLLPNHQSSPTLMATSTPPSLETLHSLVLDRICEYLDDDARRSSLWNFSLTSKSCYIAAAPERLSQIQLRIQNGDDLQYDIERTNKILSSVDGHRHVRRLKIVGEKPGKVTDEERRRPEEIAEDEIEEDEIAEAETPEGERDFCEKFYSDVHDFCRPSSQSLRRWSSLQDRPKAWIHLCRFIQQLPGLQDLAWAYGSYVAPSFLSTLTAQGCRLHMHHFHLPSLIQPWDSPQNISDEDYALVTSGCLSSINTAFNWLHSEGYIDYTEDAVKRMVRGITPSLAHVILGVKPGGTPGELWINQAIRLPKPSWQGFFPGESSEARIPPLNNLKSLAFRTWQPRRIIDWVGSRTEFTQLRCFHFSWGLENGVALAEIAKRGGFGNLRTLLIDCMYYKVETNEGHEALNSLLGNVNPLERLDLNGYISNVTFDIILNRHGQSLRSFSLHPFGIEIPHPFVRLSHAVLSDLGGKCPYLEELELPILRTRGDEEEIGIYRALSQVPRLRRASLTLGYWVGPDEQLWNEQRDGEHPLYGCRKAADIGFAPLREAFSNGAIDSALALSIFNLISSNSNLRELRIIMKRNTTRRSPANAYGSFQDLLEWLNRSWICKRDSEGRATARQIEQEEEIAYAGEEWHKRLTEGEIYNDEDALCVKVFKDLWPQKTSKWENDWTSLPLSVEQA
jgi:hypothetical protein